jgi:putative ABC transport system permease protein
VVRFNAALDRKLLRELWQLRGQLLSIALVVASGVMTVVALRGTYDSLASALERYYRVHRFADVFVSLERAPEPLARRVEALSGVAEVHTRVRQLVTLDVPGLDEPAMGLLLSIPSPPGPTLNDLYLLSGRLPAAADEVLVSQSFFGANALELGSSLGALIEGRWWQLRVVGVALSPDYIGEVPPGGIFPDDRRFGILRMNRDVLGPASGMEGAFNDLSLTLAPGANQEAVIAALDALLLPYGGQGAYGRDEHLSHATIETELNQNRLTGTIIPAVFLGVAAFLLNVVLGRLVGTQRNEIAVLKAFGYTDLQVGRHYLRFALAATLGGGLLGVVLGAWAGGGLVQVYGRYFRFPDLEYQIRWPLLVFALGVSVGAAVLGARAAVRRAVKLAPAEAMRPEAPAHFRPGPIEKLGLGRLLSASGRLIVRNVERQPLRSATFVLGVALAEVLVLAGMAFYDSVDRMKWVQFDRAQREDLAVAFTYPRPARVADELRGLPGVYGAELYRSVAARISHGHRRQAVALTGMSHDAALRRIVDRHGAWHPVPPQGLLLDAHLARTLGVRPGDTVEVSVLEGERPTRSMVVAGTVDELFGKGVYLDLAVLRALLREDALANGAWLAVEKTRLPEVMDLLKRLPGVGGVYAPEVVRQNFEKQLAESLLVSIGFLVVLACVLTAGIVYNGARIALAERSRELASLRVLGFTRKEISVLLLGEQGLLTVLAIPLGWGLGLALLAAMMPAFSSDQIRIPMVVSQRTLLVCTGVILVAALLAGLSVHRRLKHLDLVEVLKTRE